ncbi:MAG: ABC transporter ATP-binding protein/permease [Desulfobacteraceae bacterium]|nr:ABC transporter ATP-binding protein/permease [Desulfobacteraceae bacterium]
MRGGTTTIKLDAVQKSPENQSSWRSVRLVAPLFKRHFWRLLGGFLALMLVDLLQLFIPRVVKTAVDGLQAGAVAGMDLLRYGGYIVGIALVIGGFRYVWRQLIFGFSRILEIDLRNRMVSHVLGLDKRFFQRTTTGEVMALATNDLSSVQLASGMGLVAFVDAVFMGLAAIGFMLYIHPVLTVIAVAPMPVLAIVTRLLSSRLHHRFKKVQEQFSILTEFARSTFSSIRLVKAYNQEDHQARRFGEMGEEYVRNNLKLAFVYGTLFPISGFIGNASMLLVLFFGGKLTIEGAITAGDFVAFISYLFLMTWPMMAMGWVADLFQRGVTSLARIEWLLREEPVLRDRPGAVPAPLSRGSFRLRGLTFAYPGHSEPRLKGIDLDIREGTFLGIVGRTGAGKSTLCNILARLSPVPDETYLFDGLDVNGVTIHSVRGAIAYVPQDLVLFSDTIASNIALGRPDASAGEIEKVARAAAIHDEIVAMPEGYQTRIGEKGVKLSGGQRQRIAIARALLLQRPVIILDDALSAVDMETEHEIIRSIASYLAGRTCIVVSHRVAPLADAEEIVVMDGGRIVDRGSHDDLIGRNAFYATIYRHQTSGRTTVLENERQ